MGSLNFRVPQNGEEGAEHLLVLLVGGFPIAARGCAPHRQCCSWWAHGRREGGLNPTALHLKRPLFGKEGWGLGGAAPAALNAVSKSRGGAENGETVNL